MLQIFRILSFLSRCRGALAVLSTSFLTLAGRDPGELNLLVLEDVSEGDSCHVGIVGSLVVVREQGLTIVVTALVLSVVAAFEIVFEFVVIDTLLVDLPQARIVKCLRVVGEHLRVVGVREATAPFLGELEVSLGEGPNELVVQVEPIVHAVVADDRLLCLDHRLDYKREAHFVYEEFFFGILRCNKLLH